MGKNRLWTEDELALLYWFLPTMRKLSELTDREFPAIAMKLANLLAVETDYTEGLANASFLDKQIVAKYKDNREELENRIITILKDGINAQQRIDEIKTAVFDILKTHGVPLHIEIIRDLINVKNPMLFAPTYLIREVIKDIPCVQCTVYDVFEFKQ